MEPHHYTAFDVAVAPRIVRLKGFPNHSQQKARYRQAVEPHKRPDTATIKSLTVEPYLQQRPDTATIKSLTVEPYFCKPELRQQSK